MIRAENLPSRRSGLAIPLAVAGAVLVGAAIGSERSVALVLLGAACGAVALALPVVWLFELSLVAALTFRVLAPTASGPFSTLPDATLALVFVRVAMDTALRRPAAGPRPAKALAIVLGLFLSLALASTLRSGDPSLSLVASIRQFLRFPLWALALSVSGLTWQEARGLVKIVLAVSLIQLPFALYQYRSPFAANPYPGVHFFKGDNVSGTFGLGGSGTEMVFLVMAALVWVGLVLHGARGWILCIVAPFLVVPMALGSVALYVLLLPAALIALFVRSALSPHARLTPGRVVGGVFLVGVAVWAAGSFALAPGFAGSRQGAATSVLSNAYLHQYLNTTEKINPTDRIGFLRLAVEADLASGPGGILLGQGPSRAVIGPEGIQVGAGRDSVLTPASVQSVQRLFLGYGFPGPILYVVMVLVPVVWVYRRAHLAVDGMARTLALVLPVAAGVFLITGPYNAAWSDPGVAATFWCLAMAAVVGVAPRPGEGRASVSAVASSEDGPPEGMWTT
jgi:hypothetical protein